MPVWPKSFFTFGASVRTAATARRLRNRRGGIGAQNAAFHALRPKLAVATWWRQAGIDPQITYADFRSRIPPQRHANLRPAIARMERGEADVLWPGRCMFFAATSGTTTGEARLVPVTADALAHFRRGTADALWYYTARVGHAGVCRGRHLYLGGNTALTPRPADNGAESFAAELGGVIRLGLSPAADKHLIEPAAALSSGSEGLPKFDAIAMQASQADISLIAGIPSWVLQFAERMRRAANQQQNKLIELQGFWPNLECLLHVGVPIAPFQRELRQALGAGVRLHEVYAACEGIIGAQDADSSSGLRLMTDVGIFFEFLPLVDFDESRIEHLGPKALPLADVKPGVDYVVLLTTPAGLVRYCLGDVIRFSTTEPPRFAYVGRTNLRLDPFGEQVDEREVTEALVSLCVRHQWSLVNFHVAPLFTSGRASQHRGAHEWWIELRPGLRETPTGPQMGSELDAELQRLNPDYASRRKSGVLDAPTVRLVMPGVFDHWLRFRGKWGGQNKMPRCRSDRAVADELGQVTNFARE